MKGVLIASFIILFALSCYSQKVRVKSNSIPFKGSAVVAEEKRIEEEKKKEEEAKILAEQKRIEDKRKKEEEQILAEARKEEEQQRSAELQKVTLDSLGITVEQLPKYYALIMGVSVYQNASTYLPNLDHPIKDSQALKKVLIDNYTFHEEQISFLANPTKKLVIESLEHLAEVVTERDNVLVFYAGHGVWDKQKDFGYWLATDADIKDKSSWIPNSTLKDYLGAIKSKHTLLIADACFSGSIFKSRSADPYSMIKKFAESYREKSRRAITSGNLSTVPDKSIFLEQLVKKLRDNEKLFMSSRLLFSRIYEPISNNTNNEPQMGIIDGVGDEGGDFIFIKKN